MDVLYISQTGMAEALGQSQVLSYLVGLAGHGVSIELLSFERPDASAESLAGIRARCHAADIRWEPLVRSPSHALATKVRESGFAVARALGRALRGRPRIVHARSYLPAAVADVVASACPGARMLFDCRGMLGDEYVDAGYWTRDRIEYRLLKHYEKRAFRRADGVVVLTQALGDWVRREGLLPLETPLSVIPCCVDTDRFVPNPDVRRKIRAELGVPEDALVLTYSGQLGALYLDDEMARFAGAVAKRRANTVLLVLTPSNPEAFREKAALFGLPASRFITRKVAPERMHEVLTAADLGVSFIRACFSKMGSSPTKTAEYFACGAPCVLNAGVGDQGAWRRERACIVLDDFGDEDIARAADLAVAMAARPHADRVKDARAFALQHFSLESVGVPRYLALYRALGVAGARRGDSSSQVRTEGSSATSAVSELEAS